jgi:pyridoxine 4-dehydrogenase
LRRQIDENLESLGLDALDLVNVRLGNADGLQPGSIAEPFETLVELQRQGVIRHLGVSNATVEQIAEAVAIAPIVCAQNMYNLAHRGDDSLIDRLAAEGVAYVPLAPLAAASSCAHLLRRIGGERRFLAACIELEPPPGHND